MLLVAFLALAPACAPKPAGPAATVAAADAAEGAPADAAPLRIGMRKPLQVGDTKPRLSPSGVRSWVLREGDGPTPSPGQIVQVHYAGFMTDGTAIDSSLRRGQPLTFTVGAGEVIPGWDESVGQMKVGELRQIRIPPEMGYGVDGGGRMPPNTTLIFDIELVAILS